MPKEKGNAALIAFWILHLHFTPKSQDFVRMESWGCVPLHLSTLYPGLLLGGLLPPTWDTETISSPQ